jgi:hypothetical protein
MPDVATGCITALAQTTSSSGHVDNAACRVKFGLDQSQLPHHPPRDFDMPGHPVRSMPRRH